MSKKHIDPIDEQVVVYGNTPQGQRFKEVMEQDNYYPLYIHKRMLKGKDMNTLEVAKQLKEFVLGYTKNGLDKRFVKGSFDIIKNALKENNELKKQHQIDIDLLGMAYKTNVRKETQFEDFERLKERIQFLKEYYKRELNRGYDADGIPLNEINWYVTANLYNCMCALEAIYESR